MSSGKIVSVDLLGHTFLVLTQVNGIECILGLAYQADDPNARQNAAAAIAPCSTHADIIIRTCACDGHSLVNDSHLNAALDEGSVKENVPWCYSMMEAK